MTLFIYNSGDYILEKESFFIEKFRRFREYLGGVTVARSHINRIKPEFISTVDGDILEIGGTDDFFKKRYQRGDVLNLDVQAGPHIDLVENAEHMTSIENERFSAIICVSVLEHTHHPSRVMEEMYRVLQPGGKILLSTPWLFEAHMEPQDYWRFSNHFFTLDQRLETEFIESSNGYSGLLAHFCQHQILLRCTLGLVFLACDLLMRPKFKWATQITCVLKRGH
ncbi:MAG: methyltransferase domain-containing protein [Gammaproteobacteria bacterium]|nr:methyltransferase domain-containing protein [Gammaproteobacteria bacterium]